MKDSAEIDARVQTIRLYGHNPNNPDAVAQISQYGDVGWLWSIRGERFWERADIISEKARGLDLKTLEGYVTPGHARLIRMVLGKMDYTYTITAKKWVKKYGREMCWGVWYLDKDITHKGGGLEE